MKHVCRAAFLLLLVQHVASLSPLGLTCSMTHAAPGTAESNPDHANAPIAPAIRSQKLAARQGVPDTRFHRLTPKETGIDFIHRLDPKHAMRRLYHSGFVCGGVAVGDVDGDGRVDLYLISGPGPNQLYRQVADFQFENVTAKANVDGGDAWGAGAAMADIDNDGDLDIFVCNYDAPNLLYVNRGDGTFVESAKAANLDVADASLMGTFCDYDRDGDLDLYLLTNRFYREGGRPSQPPVAFENGVPHVLPEHERYYALKRRGANRYQIDSYGRADRLLRNNGDGTFQDVTATSGVSGHGYGLSATWWDYNADGFPDLYVCNDFSDPDRLYHNNGDGTFRDVLKDTVPHTTWFSMGSDVGDINNDGLFDFFSVDMSATTHFKQKTTMGVMNAKKLASVAGPPPQYMRNALFLNTGTGRFMEVAYLAGLADSDWSWTAKLADLDNDGRIDVLITNGMVRNFNDSDIPFDTHMLVGQTEWDIFKDAPPRPEQNLAYRNEGDLKFTDASRLWGLDHVGMSYAAAHADMDRDGDLDLIIVNLDEPVSVLRNDSTQGSRVTVRLRGAASNTYGIGATVRLECGADIQVRYLNPYTGFLASNEPLVHFGLGDHTTIDRLTVQWPSGVTQAFEKLPADHHFEIWESDRSSPPPQRESEATLFTQSDALRGVRHRERPYDDFQRQPLLPHKLSRLGPGMAWGDIDRDGDEDAYIGGATGQSGTVCINDGSGQFTLITPNAVAQDAKHEDMGALWVDVDGDGDLDLYVVSGGVEHDAGSHLLGDRLYLNDGKGMLTRAPQTALPDDARDSGSVVTACDVDRDGDLDLFVGGRVIPGQYPLSPLSRLFRNEGGRFVDVTDAWAPELSRTGLVTSALWSDVDADGWCDLLVTHEWGPVKLFRNQQGRLVDRTDESQIGSLVGWWNGIAGGDLDGDGDIDYVVTNCGLNTKYHASPDQPARLYYGDFEQNGRMRLVEAEFEADHLYPIRGKSCSTNAMPFLGKKFTTYKDFARADLDDLYTQMCIDQSSRLEATTLQTGVLINDGQGRFDFRPLPRLAQAAPGFGVSVCDFNTDGYPDIYLVQNFFGPQPETGHMDGGVSLLLIGKGDGTFVPVSPRQSGLLIPGDAKSLATTDLNADGRVDLVVGVNNDRVACFVARHESNTDRVVTVTLQGYAANHTAIGARVTVQLTDGRQQTAEVYGGSGYLSQSTPRLTFGLGPDAAVKAIDVVWPSGKRTRREFNDDESRLAIEIVEEP